MGIMRRSTLCLRFVHPPLRWLHPAEGSLFLDGTDRYGNWFWIEATGLRGQEKSRGAGSEQVDFKGFKQKEAPLSWEVSGASGNVEKFLRKSCQTLFV